MSNMHQGLDLSRFKKISSDKKTTTLRHSKGHEIRIAHSGLTPKMRERLESLEMAEGGKVKKYAEGTPDEPVAADDDAPEAMDPASPAEAEDTPDDVSPQTAPGIPPKPDHMPAADVIDVVGERPAPAPKVSAPSEPPPPAASDFDKEDALWAQDLKNGHITPQTYQSLFAKQDTLGKLGTMFGLLISGAGSGLAHQPNAVMSLMEKQIQNDLQAQIQSKHNANNYYNTAINMMKGGADADYVASQTALNRMNISAMQEFGHIVDNMPPGAYQARAQQLLQQMMPQVAAKNAMNNQQLSGALNARAALRTAAKPSQFQAGQNVDYDRMQNLANMDRWKPGIGMSSSDLSKADDESKDVERLRSMAGRYKHAFNQLDTMMAGEAPGIVSGAMDLLKNTANMAPNVAAQVIAKAAGPIGNLAKNLQQWRLAETAALGDEFGQMVTHRYNAEAATNIANGMLPSMYDFGDQKLRNEKFAGGMNLLDSFEQSPTLKRWKLVSPKPYQDYISEHSQQGQQKEENDNKKQKQKESKKIDFADPNVKRSMAQ